MSRNYVLYFPIALQLQSNWIMTECLFSVASCQTWARCWIRKTSPWWSEPSSPHRGSASPPSAPTTCWRTAPTPYWPVSAASASSTAPQIEWRCVHSLWNSWYVWWKSGPETRELVHQPHPTSGLHVYIGVCADVNVQIRYRQSKSKHSHAPSNSKHVELFVNTHTFVVGNLPSRVPVLHVPPAAHGLWGVCERLPSWSVSLLLRALGIHTRYCTPVHLTHHVPALPWIPEFQGSTHTSFIHQAHFSASQLNAL